MDDIFIPVLEHGCGSWIVCERSTGKAVAEFYNRATVERVNHRKYVVYTAMRYLQDLNRRIRDVC